jgi:glycine oxidase
MNVDYIIVGQGIAGTVIAEELQNRGQKILVIDNHHHESSSLVAAGLYNPVVFRVFSKSYMADLFFPAAKKFYSDLQQKLGVTLDHPRSLLKLFSSEHEANLWNKELEQNKFLGPVYGSLAELQQCINMPYGCGEVPEAGYVDLPLFLSSYRNKLLAEDKLVSEEFSFENLKILNDGVTWKNFSASKIIFCEGHAATKNPYFNYLPFKLTKGETLDVEIKNISCEKAVNKGVFVLPMHDGSFKVGATYTWNDLTNLPTEEGKKELLTKLNLFLKCEYKIKNHAAGIRPTVTDRRPYLGLHPQYPALCIFNGLGTKGVLMAPFLANHLADFLLKKEFLIPEINISRHEKRNKNLSKKIQKPYSPIL